jgi:single-strand DNA-binding protein
MNKVQLHGYCGKDPEVKTLESGKKVAKFTFATSESYKDSTGVRQTNTEWHSIVVWDKLAELCEKYVKKGSELILEGKISYRDYTDKDGVKKYYTEIICNGLEFCGKKESAPVDDKQGEYQKSGKVDVKSMSNPEDLPQGNDDLSDLPFIFTIPIALGFLMQFIV